MSTGVRHVGTVTRRVGRAASALREGRPVVLVNDVAGRRDGVLMFAGEHATPALVAFAVRHTSGFLCVALPGHRCDELELPVMRSDGGEPTGGDLCVSVDALGTGTGISASSRATTIALLAAADSSAAGFSRPGHVVPIRARGGGVLARPGDAEAAVDLARLAGLQPVAALCGVVSKDEPGAMARGDELNRFAIEQGLEMIAVSELIAHLRRSEPGIVRMTAGSPFARPGHRVHRFRTADGVEQLALAAGGLKHRADIPVYVHAACSVGDVFGSVACNCGHGLEEALAVLASRGRGIVVCVRLPGVDSCGSAEDEHSLKRIGAIEVAAGILRELEVDSVRPIGVDPDLGAVLSDFGFDVGPALATRSIVM